jgi:hypothetical protein
VSTAAGRAAAWRTGGSGAGAEEERESESVSEARSRARSRARRARLDPPNTPTRPTCPTPTSRSGPVREWRARAAPLHPGSREGRARRGRCAGGSVRSVESTLRSGDRSLRPWRACVQKAERSAPRRRALFAVVCEPPSCQSLAFPSAFTPESQAFAPFWIAIIMRASKPQIRKPGFSLKSQAFALAHQIGKPFGP